MNSYSLYTGMERSSQIPWQDDCYMVLKSTPKSGVRKKMEDAGWLRKNKKSLQRFITGPLLVDVVNHMRKSDMLSVEGVGIIREAGSLEDKVHALVELLFRGDPQGGALQSYLQNAHPDEYNLITLHDPVVQQHKNNLLQRVRDDKEILSYQEANQTSDPILLVDGVSDLQHREHDLIQVSVNRGVGPLHSRSLSLDKLLAPLTRVSTVPRVTLTVGVAGSGKTRLVRKFVYKWSFGKIFPELSLAIPIACWELSSLDRLSLERLLRLIVPYDNVDVILNSFACKVLLIFDGLEEFRFPLDFSEAPATSDPRRELPVSDLVTNIIRGNLLPGASLWLLSRPGVGAKVPAGLVDRVTEVPPFLHDQIEGYIKHAHLPEEDSYTQLQQSTQSNCQMQTLEEKTCQAWAHLRSQKSLLILCSVPCICHIVTATLSHLVRLDLEDIHFPRTLTEVYSLYCWPRLCSTDPSVGNIRKHLGTLGRLAFYSLLRQRHTFNETELRTYGVDLPPPLGTLGYRILQQEQSWSSDSVAWRFVHTSVQEFLGALFYYMSSRRGMFDLFSESSVSWPRIGFQNHYRAALQKTTSSTNGKLDLFMRFLSGLLSSAAGALLGGALGVSREEQVNQRTIAMTLLQNTVTTSGGEAVSMRSVATVACLAELQQGEWIRSVEEDLTNCRLRGKLNGGVCSVLAYLLQVSESCANETHLSNCMDSASLKQLLPQLLYCSKLRMENNEFKNDAMELLGSLLSAKDCHIQSLSMADSSISCKGVKPLSRALLVNRTLTALDLHGNKIGTKGAKTLAEALKMNQFIVSVNLQSNKIEDEGARALAEVLQSNRKLTTLNVSGNHMGDLGALALAQALVVNNTLQTLSLRSNSVSDRGMKALTQALRHNKGLTKLNLRENSIGVEGARAIARALQENHTLRELDLQWNFLKVGAAKALAQALRDNEFIQLLDLQENALGEDGVIALAGALKANSTLGMLYLQGVSAGEAGAVALAKALTVNRSLHTLDLRSNSIGMGGAKAISSALKKNRSLRSLNLQENSLGMDGAIFIATALRGNHQLAYIK
ncbi:NLR family CARD domain-containing protein 3 [Bagarius yarrelli]|uniref:NLR family CARD domain-containing protein 3 n=1 Tax=Bagarius yarrelli TaxID=175774 RepID=A0A556U1G6_BAGYA|nr:NLR family CARD domain-containing protein 3 [Bagarius yarrelli]